MKKVLTSNEIGRLLLSDITFLSRYSRHDLGLFTYYDSFRNLINFYLSDGLVSKDDSENMLHYAKHLALFPSMRSIQFQPVGFLSKHERMYNCSGIIINSLDSIWKTFYLLLCGCGVGFNICKRHISNLPRLVSRINKEDVYSYTVEDDVKGWATASKILLYSYFVGNDISGKYVQFDYSKITPKGVMLRSCGRPAPGPEPLRKSLESVRKFLDGLLVSGVREVKPIHVYDVILMLASSVMAGGVRRSALISLFSRDDDEMMNAKTGDWFSKYPWRAYSNNSFIVTREDYYTINRNTYSDMLHTCLEYGEPGIVHLPDEFCVVNPCVEIVFRPEIDGEYSYQMCNLVELCLPNISDGDGFYDAVRYASLLGTIQYTYHDFWCDVARRIAYSKPLIGISLTGLSNYFYYDGSSWKISKLGLSMLGHMARYAVSCNKYFVGKLGGRISEAERVTCIKPSGTVSCIAMCSSGVHPWYSHRYIRNINVRVDEPSFHIYRKVFGGFEGYHHYKDDNTRIIGFPIHSSNGCTWESMSAVNMLRIISDLYKYWIIGGYNRGDILGNSISCTILYDKSEIDEISDCIYSYNRSSLHYGGMFPFVGISFLPRMSKYPNVTMPFCPANSSDEAQKYYDSLCEALKTGFDYDEYRHYVSEFISKYSGPYDEAVDSVYKCDNELCSVQF